MSVGSERRLNELGPSPEIDRTSDLIGVVMVGAFNDIEGLRWLGRLEDLAAQLNGDDVVFVAVNDQLRERELRKAVDQGKVGSEQPRKGSPEQRPSNVVDQPPLGLGEVELGKHEPMPLRFGHRAAELSRRIDPELNGLIGTRKRLFLGRAVSHASREFRDFSDKHLILIAPIDNDLVFMHQLLLPV